MNEANKKADLELELLDRELKERAAANCEYADPSAYGNTHRRAYRQAIRHARELISRRRASLAEGDFQVFED